MARLVICDDETHITDILSRFFREKGHEVFGTVSAEEAAVHALERSVDLVITDIAMQGLSGFDLLKRIKASGSDIPVIITTGNPSHHSAVQALREGAFDYVVKPFHLEEILERAERALAMRRIREENVLYSKLVSLHSISRLLAEAADTSAAPEGETFDHVKSTEAWARLVGLMVDEHCVGYQSKGERVAELGRALLRELRLPEAESGDWDVVCRVYDLPKLRVPQHILLKPKALTDQEKAFVKSHASWARDCLAAVPGLGAAARVVEDFQERFDGTGGPRGAKGHAILALARLLAVADAYVALQSDRPYRPAYPESQAFDLLRAESGLRFDPEVVLTLSRIRGA